MALPRGGTDGWTGSGKVEKALGTPVTIDAGTMQRVLERHVREQLEARADLRVLLG